MSTLRGSVTKIRQHFTEWDSAREERPKGFVVWHRDDSKDEHLGGELSSVDSLHYRRAQGRLEREWIPY